ncbi:MAG: hypothetical protein NVS2B7_35260 [Herpetosiphon sp.]
MVRIGFLAVLVSVVALGLFSVTAAPTITDRNGGSDGGELSSVAASGGVAHPSGYPTYIVLARAAIRAFPGEVAGRLVRLSVLGGTLAVGMTALVVGWALMNGGTTGNSAAMGGAYAGLLLMTTERLWGQATIVEVYAVYWFFLVLCVGLGYYWLLYGGRGTLFLASICIGLGLGTHLTLLAVVPGVAAGWLVMPRRQPITPSVVGIALGGFLCGISVFGLVPIWAQRHAIPSWGDAAELHGFWRQVSGGDYHYLVGIVPWSQRLGRIGFLARDLLDEPGIGATVLAAGWGVPYCWRHRRSLLALTGVLGLANAVFAIVYGAADGTVYLLPWTWSWCVWAGAGLYALTQQLADNEKLALGRFLLPAVVAGLLLWSGATKFTALNLSGDTSTRDEAQARLRSLPADAILYSDDDAPTFNSWYVQYVLKTRRDVQVVDTRLLTQHWYRGQLKRVLGFSQNVNLCSMLQNAQRPSLWVSASGEVATHGTVLAEQACID